MMRWYTDLFNFSGQALTRSSFATSSDLSHQLVQFLLAQNSLALAFKHITWQFWNGWLTHHAVGAACSSRISRTCSAHRDGLRWWDVEVLRDGHLLGVDLSTGWRTVTVTGICSRGWSRCWSAVGINMGCSSDGFFVG